MTGEGEALRRLGEELRDKHDIQLADLDTGREYRVLCPECSAGRKHKRDPDLVVKIDADGRGATWLCHHCGWKDGLHLPRERDAQPKRGAAAKAPKPMRAPASLEPAHLEWLTTARAIPEAVIREAGIGSAAAYFDGEPAQAVAFVYRERAGGPIVGVKYRRPEPKAYSQESGSAQIFYGLDLLDCRASEITITEGELDALACRAAEIRNVLSVPGGGLKEPPKAESDSGRKFEFLQHAVDRLANVKRVNLALDVDGPGCNMAAELARRLGLDRCRRVRWPDGNDALRKDANEVLQLDGPKVLRECIENAEPYPVEGLYGALDFAENVTRLFDRGHEELFSTTLPGLDQLYRVRPGDLCVVSGAPGDGKTEMIDAMMAGMARAHAWRFGVCSLENEADEHIARLCEKFARKRFWPGPSARMSREEMMAAMQTVESAAIFIRPPEARGISVERILELGRVAVIRHGIRGLVIDPWNELEHRRPETMSETEYVGLTLSEVRRFARAHRLAVWLVAHPAKPAPRDGKPLAPSLYLISGSANWANRADVGLWVSRDSEDSDRTIIHVCKMRRSFVGMRGSLTLRYNRQTANFDEDMGRGWTGSTGAAMSHRGD